MKKGYKLCLLILCLIDCYNAKAQTEVTYYTSMGSFKIMLTDTLTPVTVDSFKSRVAHKFYDGLLFHRVIDGFVIQGGDPLGTGYGGPGYTTRDEFSPLLTNVAGSLAMANSGANTNGCQFYINLVNNASLNNHYTVFGMVTSGFSVVQSIGHVPTGTGDRPVTNVYTDSIRITHFPTAVHQITLGGTAVIYPNPCKGSFTIELPNVATSVLLVNVTGQVVYQTTAKKLLHIDLANQPAGLYIVRLSNANGSTQSKLIVQ